MTDPRTIAEHGSRIIAALEHAWAAIRDTHPDVPDVVIVTGAGSNQKGTPEGYQLRGHHWPERWVLGGQDQPRADDEEAERRRGGIRNERRPFLAIRTRYMC